MKQKEIKNLAKKIAQQELILQDSSSTKEQRRQAEDEIIKLSSKINSFDDMFALDEAIQDFLLKNS